MSGHFSPEVQIGVVNTTEIGIQSGGGRAEVFVDTACVAITRAGPREVIAQADPVTELQVNHLCRVVGVVIGRDQVIDRFLDCRGTAVVGGDRRGHDLRIRVNRGVVFGLYHRRCQPAVTLYSCHRSGRCRRGRWLETLLLARMPPRPLPLALNSAEASETGRIAYRGIQLHGIERGHVHVARAVTAVFSM